eukprot:TRINITY_DN340_c0_g1_i8.p1 TRINITY_DN340_c0_g1~~TRINITY_DN340_c0_g1_i8.p1  ORF type:complete len:245 (-),score=65.45 TRINITY_DN340_c0_g1_i8:422-1156(-)
MSAHAAWGILSTANIANKVADAIQASINAKVVAVASRSQEKAQEFAKKWNIATVHGSYQALIDDPEVQAVYIPLPTSMKEEWVIKAANKGKHVLVEKPLISWESTERMIAACNANGVQFLDGTMWRHHPRTLLFETLLFKNKILGDIYPRRTECTFSYAIPDETNIRYDAQLEPSGTLGDLGWYCVLAILWSHGKFGQLSIKVFANTPALRPSLRCTEPQWYSTFRGNVKRAPSSASIWESSPK